MPRYATAKEVTEHVVTLTYAALQCRDLGHQWRTADIAREGRNFARTLRCERNCQVFKKQRLNHRGFLIGKAVYDYPKFGYKFDEPLGIIKGDAKAAVRLAALYKEMETLDNGANPSDDLRRTPRKRAAGGGKNHAHAGNGDGDGKSRGRRVPRVQAADRGSGRKTTGNRSGSQARRTA